MAERALQGSTGSGHGRWPCRITAALALLVFAPPARAQLIRPSQDGAVMQAVGRTRIEIAYRRPTARGRALFGALVPYGRVWTPSADSAATIRVSTPVEVNGQRLEAGTYSLWAFPDTAAWTVIFSAVHPVLHTSYPEGRDALRLRVPTRAGDHMETLAFYFPAVDADSATLALHWGGTVVALSIRSRP